MSLGLRINFVDVVCDDSLKNNYINGEKVGFQFDIRLSYYRGHYLSDIELFEVYVDGQKISNEDINFGINGKEFCAFELPFCISEFWTLLEPAKITVRKPGGLSAGKHHIKVMLLLRIPYLPLPGGEGEHNYVPADCCGEKVLEMKEPQGGL